MISDRLHAELPARPPIAGEGPGRWTWAAAAILAGAAGSLVLTYFAWLCPTL